MTRPASTPPGSRTSTTFSWSTRSMVVDCGSPTAAKPMPVRTCSDTGPGCRWRGPRGSSRRRLLVEEQLWFRSQGCVIATVDGRGTQNRGSQFEQAVHPRVGDIEVGDQLVAVRHLVAEPWIDPERVGVHGWSYDGYVTLSRSCCARPSCSAAPSRVRAGD